METNGAEVLRKAMDRAALNPNSLSVATDGEVSPTTVRTYLSAGKASPSKVLALARVLGDDGIEVVEAFGFPELRDHLIEARHPAAGTIRESLGMDQAAFDRQPPESLGMLEGPNLSPAARKLVIAVVEFLQDIEARRPV